MKITVDVSMVLLDMGGILHPALYEKLHLIGYDMHQVLESLSNNQDDLASG